MGGSMQNSEDTLARKYPNAYKALLHAKRKRLDSVSRRWDRAARVHFGTLFTDLISQNRYPHGRKSNMLTDIFLKLLQSR
jgi:hypothetical protein